MAVIVEKLKLGTGKIKVLIKDSIDIENTVSRAGSRALADAPAAQQNAEIIDHILNADCTIIGKANLHELAFGITGINHFTGTPINPHYPQLICGGSSSGSAVAVADGSCDFSIGTDTGGSIRMPAACCGIYGLKPTFARVSRKGVLPAASSLDCVGPMANDLEMLMYAMQIIDPTFQPAQISCPAISQLKLAYLDVPASAEIWHEIQQFFHIVGLNGIKKQHCSYIEAAFAAAMQIINYETAQAFAHLLPSKKLGLDIQTRLAKATQTTLADVHAAEQVRQLFSDEIDQLLADYHVLILPTLPTLPPKVAEVENSAVLLNLTALIRPFNLSGHPAINLPLQTVDGQPVGLQLVAAHGQDEQLCLIAQMLMENFHTQRRN